VSQAQTYRQCLGAAAEQAVVQYLTRLGWQILDRNIHAGRYELDIVARQSSTIVVVEVRCRGPGSITTGFGSLSPTKRMRVRRAGERLWHAKYRLDETVEHMRFDAASVHFDEDGQARVEYAIAAY
jgi:putative endonuclease